VTRDSLGASHGAASRETSPPIIGGHVNQRSSVRHVRKQDAEERVSLMKVLFCYFMAAIAAVNLRGSPGGEESTESEEGDEINMVDANKTTGLSDEGAQALNSACKILRTRDLSNLADFVKELDRFAKVYDQAVSLTIEDIKQFGDDTGGIDQIPKMSEIITENIIRPLLNLLTNADHQNLIKGSLKQSAVEAVKTLEKINKRTKDLFSTYNEHANVKNILKLKNLLGMKKTGLKIFVILCVCILILCFLVIRFLTI
jgi:archaellum component FlaC